MTWYRLIGAVVLSLTTSVAMTSAQPPAPPPTTAVLVNLTIKPDVDRQQVMSIMPEEVRATLKLYLEGKIQQWYSRGDGRGVLFIMNSTSLADEWVRLPNSNPVFARHAPIVYMIRGGLPAMQTVRRLLDARRAG